MTATAKKTMRFNIVTLAYAVGHRMTAAQVEGIAAWHDDKAEHAETSRAKTRHEVMSFKLSKLANDLRKLEAA